MPKHRSPEFEARIKAAKKPPDEDGITRPGRKSRFVDTVSEREKPKQLSQTNLTEQRRLRLRLGRKRKTSEEAAIEGFAGYTKEQIRQHLNGERIFRIPKIWIKFKDPALMKLKGTERVKRFFDKYITHTEGEWKGKKWQWEPWQVDLIDRLFGTLKENEFRQYKECLLEIAKKNGKTELGAGIGIYCLIADKEGAPEVLLAAKDRVQAKKCYEAAERMVNQRKALSASLKVLKSQKKIIYVKESGYLEVVSKDSGTQHGRNISALIFDELHAQQGRDLFDVLTEGSGAARRQPLFLYLTTAGWDRTSICYEVHEKALRVLKDPSIDPNFLPIIYAVPENADWENEENWKLANPALGHIFTMENLREDYRKAKENPAKENVFRRLRLNQWTSVETKWISVSEWDRCGKPLLVDTLPSRKCVGGLDLSWTTDLTAFVLLFAPLNGDGTFDILPFFWMPLEKLEEKIKRDHLPYDVWIKKDLIYGVQGKIIDYDFVRAKIVEVRKQYGFSEIAYDPMNATQMALDLEKEGLVMVQFKQTFLTYTPPMKEFLSKITTGKFRHGGHPVLRAMLDNMRVITNANEFCMPDKAHSNSRIDGITAAIMAYDRMMRQPMDEKFVYQSGSISSLKRDEEEDIGQPKQIESEEKTVKILCFRCNEDTEDKPYCPHCGVKIIVGVN